MVKNLLHLLFFALCACATVAANSKDDIKKAPEYTDIDSKFKPYVNSYILLAEKHDIKFTKAVTMGFKNIDLGLEVGLCTWGDGFREIDVDKHFWDKSSHMTRRDLVYHELTHCLCTRKHDFGKDLEYPEGVMAVLLDIPIHFRFYESPTVLPGYYEDGCPSSIMHPTIVDDSCMEDHEDEYLNEMFNRCNPW